ncbi:MAG: Mu-like prophage major head subunit gpT family protein [Phycisphaerales bacterium]
MESIIVENSINLEASVNAAKLPAVEILAYGGGIMTVPGWGAIAIELSGLELGQIPILADHESKLAGVVGHGQASILEDKLVVSGLISSTGQAVNQIVDSAKNGFPWQASVGVEVLEHTRIKAGEKVSVNNKTIIAPLSGLTVVLKGKLREVSIVGVGCDSATRVAIAASLRKGFKMEAEITKEQIRAEASTEANRIEAIHKLCENRSDGIEAKAINEGWDETRTELEILRASRPVLSGVRNITHISNAVTLEAALLNYMGFSGLGEKTLGANAMESGVRLRVNSLLDLCRAALQTDMLEIPRGRDELVRAAMSTISLPNALGNVANKLLLDAYEETAATWRAFCRIQNVADFKNNYAIQPSYFGNNLEMVAAGGELKHGDLGESLKSFKADTFGKILGIDRRDIINDDLSVFDGIATGLGRAAMRSLSDLVFTVLLGNAGNFFSEANGNYLSGADTILCIEALSSAITAMRTQRDSKGNDLDLKPATLLVPPELESVGRAILESEYIQAAQDLPTGNSLRRAVSLEVEPRLSNTGKFGNSATKTQWYLFAAPSASPMIVCFLNGKQTPTVEYFGLDQDVNRLAMSWRVYFDFGAALCDSRAAVKSKGQA